MPMAGGGAHGALHQRNELVAQIDERRIVGSASQTDLEDLPIEYQRCLDVADLERDMV